VTTDFRRLWAAAGLSNLGDGISIIAVPLLAATLTRDPVLIGMLTGVLFLPHLFLSLPAGVLVDRMEPRTAMVAANVVRALALGGLCAALAADAVTIWWLYALVFLYGATECVYDTAATGAVARLVGRDGLDGANARLQGTITITNNFLGAPVGSVLFAVAAVAPFGLHTALLVGATLLTASLPRMAGRRMGGGEPEPAAPVDQVVSAARGVRAVWAETREGMTWLLRHRTLRTLAFVSAGMAFALQLSQATIVLYALEELDIPEAAYGAFAMSAAVGAVGGAVLAPKLSRRLGRLPAMLWIGALQVLALVGLALAPTAVTAAAAFAVSAGGVATWNVLSVSLRQSLVPERLFGRVFGAWKMIIWGLLPVGSWVGGVVAAGSGLRAPWLLGAVVYGAALLLGLPALLRAVRLSRSEELSRSAQPAAAPDDTAAPSAGRPRG